jgi:hypothetical protein
MSANCYAAVLYRIYSIEARVLDSMLTVGSTNCYEMKLLYYKRLYQKVPGLLLL